MKLSKLVLDGTQALPDWFCGLMTGGSQDLTIVEGKMAVKEGTKVFITRAEKLTVQLKYGNETYS